MMLSVEISSRSYHLIMNLSNKIIIIRGNSGVGKSSFIDEIELGYASVNSNGYNFKSLKENDWFVFMNYSINNNVSFVFVIDDLDICFEPKFVELLSKDKLNYYIIISRLDDLENKSMAHIPYGVNDFCEMVNDGGREHWLELYYNIKTFNPYVKYPVILTEDSRSGLKFLRKYNSNIDTMNGKEGYENYLFNRPNMRDRDILMIVDMSVFGSQYDYLQYFYPNLCFVPNYQSFEYFLLKSSLFKYDYTQCDSPEKYLTYERYCTEKIQEITFNKPYQYTKSNLNKCYTENCCHHNRTERCDLGMNGNKLDKLFKNTEFESFINCLRNNSDVEINMNNVSIIKCIDYI